MKYCIYSGGLYEVTDAKGSLVYFKGDDVSCASRSSVLEVSEESYKEVEGQFKEVKQEINGIQGRLWRLEEEYQKKKGLLLQMMTEARQKEISVISTLIKKNQRGDADERKMDG